MSSEKKNPRVIWSLTERNITQEEEIFAVKPASPQAGRRSFYIFLVFLRLRNLHNKFHRMFSMSSFAIGAMSQNEQFPVCVYVRVCVRACLRACV